MKTTFTNKAPAQSSVMVVPVYSGQQLGKNTKILDKELGGTISARLKSKSQFQGQTGQTLSLSVDDSYGVKDIILLGMGKPEAISKQTLRALASPLRMAIASTQENETIFVSDTLKNSALTAEEIAAHMIDSIRATSYTFNKYKTNANTNTGVSNITAVVSNPKRAENLYAELSSLTDSVNWARDLGNEPPNKLTPVEYAKRIEGRMRDFSKVKVTVLDEDDMKAHNMGGILAVAQGSTANPPRMVIIEYDGTDGQQERPLGLVGKGVTFDSGGNNIKPGASMTGMKMDMCGSASVVGAMHALAARNANVHAVAVVGLTENMVDGYSIRPDDIITINGKKVEIGNTDAEGRLVLADALSYIQQCHDPDVILDFATLTGAMVMALGNVYTGVFPNDDALWSAIEKAGQESGEPGWRMPVLNAAFSNAMKGKISDLSNTGSGLQGCGASTAAAFLHAFIEKDEYANDKVRWAHFDIAGTSKQGGLASGVGVRWLDQFVRNQYEANAPEQKLDFSAAPQSQYG